MLGKELIGGSVGVLGESQGLLVMPEKGFLPLQGQARQKVSDILGGEHVTKPEEGKDLMDGSADLSSPILPVFRRFFFLPEHTGQVFTQASKILSVRHKMLSLNYLLHKKTTTFEKSHKDLTLQYKKCF